MNKTLHFNLMMFCSAQDSFRHINTNLYKLLESHENVPARGSRWTVQSQLSILPMMTACSFGLSSSPVAFSAKENPLPTYQTRNQILLHLKCTACVQQWNKHRSQIDGAPRSRASEQRVFYSAISCGGPDGNKTFYPTMWVPLQIHTEQPDSFLLLFHV